MKKKDFDIALIPKGAVVVTKAEIEAMNTYSEKLRYENIKVALDAVEELLQMAIRTEGIKAKYGDSYTHKYAKRLCQDLVEDIRKIESRYKE